MGCKQVPKRTLGRTGISISAVGLGTVKLGRNTGMKYPAAYDLPSDQQAHSLLAMARDTGINLIDTAPAYGTSEERLGQLLKGQQHDWVICSKVGEEFDGNRSHFDFSAAHARHSLTRSLKRLGRDWIDILLVHSDGNDSDIIRNTDIIDSLQRFKQEGLIRAFGLSTKTVEGGLLAAEVSDCVMVTYNRAYRAEAQVLDRCLQLGCGALLKKALASGHLPDNCGDPIAASIDFALAHPGVSSAIIGTLNPQHLQEITEKACRALELDL
ncbi:MAG TPA: aldo/keto reductase [Cellvibrionaceae bacterium]